MSAPLRVPVEIHPGNISPLGVTSSCDTGAANPLYSGEEKFADLTFFEDDHG